MPGRLESPKLLLLPARARLYGLLSATSWRSLTDLARALGLRTSSVLWHLKKLKRAGLVEQESQAHPARYRRVRGTDSDLAEAAWVLHSVPARELMQHIIRHPGQHLAQAAQALGAPRSRYWRVIKRMETAGLVRFNLRVKAHLLYPTPLALPALRVTTPREWADVKAQRSRRQKPHNTARQARPNTTA